MEKLFERLADSISALIKPNQLFVVLSVVSWGLLISPFNWVSRLEIQAEIEQFRFWIILVALVSTGAVILTIFSIVYKWVRTAKIKLKEKSLIKSIKLADGSLFILAYLLGHSPDYCQLDPLHFDVKPLREHNLVTGAMSITYSKYNDFKISDRGKKILGLLFTEKINDRADGDKIEYLRIVTGQDINFINRREF